MRRFIMLVTVAAMLAAMLVLASPASAQSENAGCKDFGNDIAGFSQQFNPFGQLLSGLAPLNDEVSMDKERICG
jgi:hypothetical protein